MKKKRLDIFILGESSHFFNWIASTIQVSNLSAETIKLVEVSDISNIKVLKNSDQMLIVENSLYANNFKDISQIFTLLNYELALLIVTDTHTEIANKSNNLNIIDTIVKPSLSIASLEHAISSLLKDYKLTQKLKRLAHYDALTGAANRYLFEDRITENLNRAKRFQEPFSLLYFDLNGFKSVNDKYGHEIGDLLLKQFVEQLNQVRRETDTIARLGGDEFCMLIPKTNETSLVILIERITQALANPFVLAGISLNIKTAIGGININDQSISLLSSKEIIRLADECVYQAKKFKETHSVIKRV